MYMIQKSTERLIGLNTIPLTHYFSLQSYSIGNCFQEFVFIFKILGVCFGNSFESLRKDTVDDVSFFF